MRVVHALNALALSALVGLSIAVYPDLPERIPLHFGASGEPDRWGDRSLLGWLLLPLVGVFSVAVLYGATWLSTRNPQYLNMPDKQKLLALPRDTQLWVLRGLAQGMYIMSLMLAVDFCLLQYGAYITAVGGNGRSLLVGGLVLTLVTAPLAAMILLLGTQRRLNQAWRELTTERG